MFDFMTDVSSSRRYTFIHKNIGIFFKMLEKKKEMKCVGMKSMINFCFQTRNRNIFCRGCFENTIFEKEISRN